MSLQDTMNAALTNAGNETNMPTVPASFLKVGQSGRVSKISGNEEIRRFLAGLGFVQGSEVKAVCNNNTGLILEVKGSRVAVDTRMAAKIHVTQ